MPSSSISIHALLAESDPAVIKNRTAFSVFLSTLSLRRATLDISMDPTFSRYFYPRSPCGERHPAPVARGPDAHISIHALLAESDGANRFPHAPPEISIHALLAESDPRDCPASSPRLYFYPRSPCGERLSGSKARQATQAISIHALLAESDGY